MEYTNAEAIKAGYPKSAILPGSKFWKKARSFSSNTSITNFDPVTTNKAGSSISLHATKADISGELGSISLLKGLVRMSKAADSVTVKCSNTSLASDGSALYLFNPEWLSIPATLDLGNGNNSVLAGLGYMGWNTGISLDAQTRLLSGTGKDIIKGSGKEIGILVGGTISTGTGNDIIEGNSGNSRGIYVGEGGRIDMGAGNDRITGTSVINDLSSGTIYANGWIDMGDGDDEITGVSFMINGRSEAQAQLLMGSGNDKLTATLHRSNAPIDFGSGVDRLYLPAGQYSIANLGNGSYSLLSTGAEPGVYGADKISGLEWIVSKSTGTEYAFGEGVITIA